MISESPAMLLEVETPYICQLQTRALISTLFRRPGSAQIISTNIVGDRLRQHDSSVDVIVSPIPTHCFCFHRLHNAGAENN